MTVLRFLGSLALCLLFVGGVTTAAQPIRAKNPSEANATASSPRHSAVSTNPQSSSPPLRRVWITYETGHHVLVLDNMEIYRSISSSLHPLHDFPSMNSIVTMASDEEIAALMANTSIGVIKVTDDPKRYPMSRDRKLQQYWDGQSTNYGIELTQVDQLRSATGLDGAGITVCVIDTGLDVTHEDFDTTGYSGVTLIDGSEWSSDSSGHGTHVSGIIAAADNTIGLVGVAPRATIYTVDIFGDYGYTYASSLIDGLYKCRDAGAQIVSMSLGGADFMDQENTLFQELYNVNGMLSVAAAGNSGFSDYSFPASYDNVLSVGAVDSSKTLAYFSTYNDKVDLAAPGVAIWSTLPSGYCEICSEIGYTRYGPLDGTSQATPFVSGIAALLMSSNPSWSVETITNALLNSAEDLGVAGRDDYYGYGLVSALSAYDLLTSSSGNTPTPSPSSSSSSPPLYCSEASLTFKTDNYPQDTFATLTDLKTGDLIWATGAALKNWEYTVTSSECLDVSGCYLFHFIDIVGDGLCCSFGQGYFELTFNNVVTFSGDWSGQSYTKLLGDGCFIF
jgi:serine protease